MVYRDCDEMCGPACPEYATCEEVQAPRETPRPSQHHVALEARVARLEDKLSRVCRALQGEGDRD